MAPRDRLPQIELAVGDDDHRAGAAQPRAAPEEDLARLRALRATHGVEWWLQPKGPDTAHPLDGAASALDYSLPEFGLRMPFRPTEFTQVNRGVNRVAGDARRAAARPAAGRARDRLVLRPGQLHPAAGDAGARR